MARGGTRTIMNFVRWLAPPVLTALAFAACAGATPSSSGQNPADVVGAGTAEGPSSQMSALIAADSGRRSATIVRGSYSHTGSRFSRIRGRSPSST